MLAIDQSRCRDASAHAEYLDTLEIHIKLTPDLSADLNRLGLVDARHCDARRSPRFRCFGYAIIEPIDSVVSRLLDQKRAIAIIRDLSRKGLGLVTDSAWYVNQEVSILTSTYELSARVVRCRYRGPSCYLTGLSITKVRAFEVPEELGKTKQSMAT
jgi:hypothetical protein